MFVDPRLADLGCRVVLPRAGVAALATEYALRAATPPDYDLHRLGHGVPDGSRDLVPQRSTLLESGFEELRGVSFDKGCFVGQELTARMKYRGLVKKRLFPVRVEGPLPPPGAIVLAGEAEVGRDAIGARPPRPGAPAPGGCPGLHPGRTGAEGGRRARLRRGAGLDALPGARRNRIGLTS
jgi:folate-binding protein YgfZ